MVWTASEIEQKKKTDLIFKKLHDKAEDELLDFSRKVAGIREGRRELPPVGQERLDYNRDLQAWTKYWETIKGLVGQVEVKDIDLTPQKK